MKSKILVLLAFLGLTTGLKADTARPIMATSIYNNLESLTNPGVVGIPLTTPFANTACFFDNTSTLQSSITTATELSYVHGATSNIQDQINAISGGSGGPRFTNTISTGYTIPTLTVDAIINVNTSVGVIPVVLPDATASRGWCVDVKNLGTNFVTVSTQFGQTIDGSSSR
jgi:hypothetical protein